MGCNCGRGQRRPAGLSGSRGSTGTNASGASANQSGSKSSSGVQTFSLTTSDGRVQTFGSMLEARAARVRAGGGIIR